MARGAPHLAQRLADLGVLVREEAAAKVREGLGDDGVLRVHLERDALDDRERAQDEDEVGRQAELDLLVEGADLAAARVVEAAAAARAALAGVREVGEHGGEAVHEALLLEVRHVEAHHVHELAALHARPAHLHVCPDCCPRA